jgi:hypothetical protein
VVVSAVIGVGGALLLDKLVRLVERPAAKPQAAGGDEEADHDHPADELGGRKLPTDEHDQHDPELDDEVGRGKHEDHGGGEVGATGKHGLCHGRRRVRARRRDGSVKKGPAHRRGPVVAEVALHGVA